MENSDAPKAGYYDPNADQESALLSEDNLPKVSTAAYSAPSTTNQQITYLYPVQ